MVAETEEATEIEMLMVADHAKMSHERDLMRAMAMKRILASCDATRSSDNLSGGGFLEY